MAYKTVIGLEVHCELNTNAKVFSPSTNIYNDIPNSAVTPGDLAMPGILPVLNKGALEKSIRLAYSLNCEVPKEVMFDRKNYFYPDLPTSCQITQDTNPIGINGGIDVEVGNEIKKVGIHNIHLETDTASLDHHFDYSVINYNRCGVPLIEIVTEPCIHDPETAVAFLETLRNIFKYADISEADTKKGQIRCDVNISLMKPDATEFGTRVEIKNINSFGNVLEAINYEVKRQTMLLDSGRGEEIIQETRRYDDTTGTTVRMRAKETADDYRYYVDANLPKYTLDPAWLEEIKLSIPMLAPERKAHYISEYNLSEYDAGVIVREKEISDYFEEALSLGIDAKEASNWITTQIMGYLNKNYLTFDELFMTPKRLKVILDAIKSGQISSKQAKELFFLVLEEKEEPEVLMKKHDMVQMDNDDELETIIKDILANNSSQVEEYKSGKTNMFDYFVGQTMKATRGKANPIKVKDILTRELNN